MAGEEFPFDAFVKLCFHLAIMYDVKVNENMDELFEKEIPLALLIQANPLRKELSDFIRQLAHMRPPDCYLSLLPPDVLTQQVRAWNCDDANIS